MIKNEEMLILRTYKFFQENYDKYFNLTELSKATGTTNNRMKSVLMVLEYMELIESKKINGKGFQNNTFLYSLVLKEKKEKYNLLKEEMEIFLKKIEKYF